ncbi:hypothetical protein [Lysobacter sp. Root690]|uniref:hypothetical protein n=1 Tax=Lysobacter sp. Root690 TaxID=1736588 RepID=UPI0006F6D29C|nr:hypothetical protein [Lysobacter sp. Root690]KRB02361.1 hypothetical protein ASD86_22685 [Lysobacter sp. Root690]
MSKNALLSIGLLLAIVTGPAWAKEGTVVHNPDGSWGCVGEDGKPIPPGTNGRWEGKLVVGSPCKPATLRVAGDIGVDPGSTSGGVRPTRAVQAGAATAAQVRDVQAAPARAADVATASFDAKGSLELVAEPAGKSISSKGVSSTKSR